MLRNRQLTVKLDKVKDEDIIHELNDERSFETKTEVIRRNLEGLGVKMFMGICIYVILDTHRQVAVARVTHSN